MSRFSDPVGDRKNSERAKAIAEECTELKAKLARVEKLRDDFKDSCDFYSYDMLRMVLEGETEPSTSSCISSSSSTSRSSHSTDTFSADNIPIFVDIESNEELIRQGVTFEIGHVFVKAVSFGHGPFHIVSGYRASYPIERNKASIIKVHERDDREMGKHRSDFGI